MQRIWSVSHLLGHFFAGADPVAFESAEDAIEAALFNPESVSGTRIISQWDEDLQVHVERRRIGDTDPFESLSWLQRPTQPLEVRVKST